MTVSQTKNSENELNELMLKQAKRLLIQHKHVEVLCRRQMKIHWKNEAYLLTVCDTLNSTLDCIKALEDEIKDRSTR